MANYYDSCQDPYGNAMVSFIVKFFATGTTTPILYEVVTDIAGRFVVIGINESINYDIKIYAADGITLYREMDNVSFGGDSANNAYLDVAQIFTADQTFNGTTVLNRVGSEPILKIDYGDDDGVVQFINTGQHEMVISWINGITTVGEINVDTLSDVKAFEFGSVGDYKLVFKIGGHPELVGDPSTYEWTFYTNVEGETPALNITGYRTGDINRTLSIAVGKDVADTVSFYGLSTYAFTGSLDISSVLAVDTINEKTGTAGVTIETVLLKDGIVKPASGYQAADGSVGWTGTFTNGDAATVTVKNGIITSVV